MAYYFFLSGIPLPITPAKLNIKTPNKNKTVTLINEGEFNILKKKGLKEISFEALLPQTKYPFANYNLGVYDASTFILALKGLEALKKPFPFIVTRMTPSGKLLFYTSMMVSLEDYSLNEDAENGLDVMLNITLKEYQYHGTTLFKTITTALGSALSIVSKGRDSSSKVENKTYTVKENDTLWSIAKRELGDGEKLTDLIKLNKLSSFKDISTGQVLRLK